MAPKRVAVKTIETSLRKLRSSHSAAYGRGGLVYAQPPQLWLRWRKPRGWIAKQGAPVLKSRDLGTWSRPVSTRITNSRLRRRLATVSNGTNMSPVSDEQSVGNHADPGRSQPDVYRTS